MSITSNFKKKTLALSGLLVSTLLFASAMIVSASAAPRFQFVSGDATSTSTTPVFNAFYGVPGIGDEANFVGLRSSNGDPRSSAASNSFTGGVTSVCADGSMFDIRSYIHNGASNLYNNDGAGSAIAKNSKIALTAPIGTTGTKFTFGSTISASNAESISDTGILDCGTKKVKLELVASTVFSRRNLDAWVSRPDSAVNGTMPLSSREQVSGDVWACWDERIYVVYTVKVVEIPEVPTPVLTCDSLALTMLSERKYRFVVTATAKNGATIEEYTFDFGDGNKQTVKTNTVEHEYAKAGNYNTTATVKFMVNGTSQMITSAGCAKQVSIKPEVPKCELPGKGHLPKDSPECRVQGVTTLPVTGAGSIAGLMAGVTAAGTLLHRKMTLKRNK